MQHRQLQVAQADLVRLHKINDHPRNEHNPHKRQLRQQLRPRSKANVPRHRISRGRHTVEERPSNRLARHKEQMAALQTAIEKANSPLTTLPLTHSSLDRSRLHINSHRNSSSHNNRSRLDKHRINLHKHLCHKYKHLSLLHNRISRCSHQLDLRLPSPSLYLNNAKPHHLLIHKALVVASDSTTSTSLLCSVRVILARLCLPRPRPRSNCTLSRC